MKQILTIALYCLLLSGCAAVSQGETTAPQSPSPNTAAATWAATEATIAPDPYAISQIIDWSSQGYLATSSALEPFYEDAFNVYAFPSIRSQYVMVVYQNGWAENIVSALNTGHVTLADLDAFDIGYYTEPKPSVTLLDPEGLLQVPLQDTYREGCPVIVQLSAIAGATLRLTVNDGDPLEPFQVDENSVWFLFSMPSQDVTLQILEDSQ